MFRCLIVRHKYSQLSVELTVKSTYPNQLTEILGILYLDKQ